VGVDDGAPSGTASNGILEAGEIDQTSYACTLAAPPAGIQTNVALATVQAQGWTICHTELYSASASTTLANNCTGTQMMVACRAVADTSILVVAAADLKSVVTTVDPAGGSNSHVSNGVAWYFTPNDSWGFFEPGDGASRSNCDTATGSFAARRLCWHTQGNVGGYRCGTAAGLNSSTAWERVLLQR
jgi:hypothetical protein